MKVKDVPQDKGMIGDHGTEVCYAVDDDGRYKIAASLGWEPKNIANEQAWDIINRDIADAIQGIRTGKLSPLAYHMTKNLMDEGLLANYSGFYRWRVKRHLRADVFNKLKPAFLKRYADIFEISIEELETVPDLEIKGDKNI